MISGCIYSTCQVSTKSTSENKTLPFSSLGIKSPPSWEKWNSVKIVKNNITEHVWWSNQPRHIPGIYLVSDQRTNNCAWCWFPLCKCTCTFHMKFQIYSIYVTTSLFKWLKEKNPLTFKPIGQWIRYKSRYWSPRSSRLFFRLALTKSGLWQVFHSWSIWNIKSFW